MWKFQLCQVKWNWKNAKQKSAKPKIFVEQVIYHEIKQVTTQSQPASAWIYSRMSLLAWTGYLAGLIRALMSEMLIHLCCFAFWNLINCLQFKLGFVSRAYLGHSWIIIMLYQICFLVLCKVMGCIFFNQLSGFPANNLRSSLRWNDFFSLICRFFVF